MHPRGYKVEGDVSQRVAGNAADLCGRDFLDALCADPRVLVTLLEGHLRELRHAGGVKEAFVRYMLRQLVHNIGIHTKRVEHKRNYLIREIILE